MRRISLFLFAICCLAGCAKIVTPVGGPKDVTPPEVVKEVPPSGQTHFTGNVIRISFNEFVTLENTMENVLISPPPGSSADIYPLRQNVDNQNTGYASAQSDLQFRFRRLYSRLHRGESDSLLQLCIFNGGLRGFHATPRQGDGCADRPACYRLLCLRLFGRY